MKKSSLKKAGLNACFLLTFVILFSSFKSLALSKTYIIPAKSARWLNYPFAINGQVAMSFCTDVVTDANVMPVGDVADQGEVCVGQVYRFTLPYTCASVTWGVYNATIIYSYSPYDKLVVFNNNIFIDGYANVWVSATDPGTGDPYYGELALFPSASCDTPE